MTSPLDALAFGIGIKPALRLSLPPADAAREEARWRARGAAVVRGETLDGRPRGAPEDAAKRVIVYVARDMVRARALGDLERSILPHAVRETPGPTVVERHLTFGRLLGYPRCCVEGFVDRLRRGVDVCADGTRASERYVAAEAAQRRAEEMNGRLNFFLPKRTALVPFDPCAFDCPVALGYADALFAAYTTSAPRRAAAFRAALLREVRLTRAGAVPSPAAAPALTLRWRRF